MTTPLSIVQTTALARARAKVLKHNQLVHATRHTKNALNVVATAAMGTAAVMGYFDFMLGTVTHLPYYLACLGAFSGSLVRRKKIELRTYALDTTFPAIIGLILPLPKESSILTHPTLKECVSEDELYRALIAESVLNGSREDANSVKIAAKDKDKS